MNLDPREKKLLVRLLDAEWKVADELRMDTTPGSVAEVTAEEYQRQIEELIGKLK